MKVRMSRAVLTFAAAIAATVTFTTTPALASTPVPANSDTSSSAAVTLPPSAITAHAAARPAAQPATDCAWYSPPLIGIYTYLGTIICEYTPLPAAQFPNGTWEVWAIGTSHAVWTAWESTSGAWDTASLGGSGYSAPWIVAQNGWGLTIGVSSSSGRHYCDNRSNSQNGGWTGWFTC
jgi:hypothetical protein